MKFIQNVFSFLCIMSFIAACDDGTKHHETTNADTPVVINNKQILKPEDRKNSFADVDISPMDMSYYPPKYPQLKMMNELTESPVMRLIYSRPHLQGRQLFPDILQYGKPWRLGANEATELQVYKTVTVGNYKLPPGRYTLHCIPRQKEWTIIFNSDVDVWGLKFDETNDLFKVEAPVIEEKNISIEYFTMVFESTEGGANLVMGWAGVIAKLPFKF